MRSCLVLVLTIAIATSCTKKVELVEETFKNPPIVTSVNGELNISLEAYPSTIQLGDQVFQTFMYNNQYIPPTLVLNPGDKLRVKLTNSLSMETNLHFHGFDVSPAGNSDNIFRTASPGGVLGYEVQLPQEHDAGTFWYHPHPCGKSEMQTYMGMSGSIIINGLFDELPPQFAGIVDRTILLKDLQPVANLPKEILCTTNVGTDSVFNLDSNAPTTRTVNGQLNPVMVIQPGETQLWRISNIGANIYYNIKLDGHKFYVVGQDGSYLMNVVEMDSILLPPAARVEVLVQGANYGTYSFKTLAMNTGPAGDNYPEVGLATLVSQGQPVQPLQIPTKLNDDLLDYRTLAISKNRQIVFTEDTTTNQFYINQQQYNPSVINTAVILGSVEEWTIVNQTQEMHVFHIHQLDFQLTQIDSTLVDFNGYNDTINMPPGSTLKILLPFVDNYLLGKFVYHCHILAHEDRGMMQTILVYVPD